MQHNVKNNRPVNFYLFLLIGLCTYFSNQRFLWKLKLVHSEFKLTPHASQLTLSTPATTTHVGTIHEETAAACALVLDLVRNAVAAERAHDVVDVVVVVVDDSGCGGVFDLVTAVVATRLHVAHSVLGPLLSNGRILLVHRLSLVVVCLGKYLYIVTGKVFQFF